MINFNRQEERHGPTRPKRLSSVLIQPSMEDFGSKIGLPKTLQTLLPSVQSKYQQAIRNQIKKYKNISLFDKSLFLNHKENRENLQCVMDSYEFKLAKPRNSYSYYEQLKINKINAKQLMQQEMRPLAKEQHNPKSSKTHIPQRKQSGVAKHEPLLQVSVENHLPSIRGWEALHNNSNRSNDKQIEYKRC